MLKWTNLNRFKSTMTNSFYSSFNKQNGRKYHKENNKFENVDNCKLNAPLTDLIELIPIVSNMMKPDYKIIVIGPEQSGKTSLINAFLGKQYKSDIRSTNGTNMISLDMYYLLF